MNVDRLYDVAQIVLNDYDSLTLPKLFGQFASTLTNSVNQPNPQNAEAFQTAKTNLEDALDKCGTNHMVPSEQQILNRMNGADLVGAGLRTRTDDILASNAMTPGNALQEINALNTQTAEFRKTVHSLIQAIDKLDLLTEEEIPADAAEIGVLLPSIIFNDDLEGLKNELAELDRHLRAFSEIAGGPKGSLKIRAVSSGSLDVFLKSAPGVAACVMVAVERLVALYKKILEIRKLRSELAEKDVPSQAIAPIEQHENETVTNEIDSILDEIMERFYSGDDSGRKNELRNAARIALLYLADRIDRGVDFEAKAPPQEEDAESDNGADEPSPTDDNQTKAIETIDELGNALKGLERSSDPVLRLEDQRKPDSNA